MTPDDKYKNIVENMNLGLLEVDLNRTIQFTNDAFCRMVGYEASELIGKKASMLLKADANGTAKAEHHAADKKGGHHKVYEIQIKKKNGHAIWALVNEGPIFDAEGQIVGTAETYQDFSNKKKIESSLKILNRELAEKKDEFFKRQEYLKAINDFSNLIADKESLEDLTSIITDSIIMRFGFEDCIIYIKDPESEFLYQFTAFGSKNDKGKVINPTQIKVGEGIVGAVAKSGKAEVIADTSKDPRYIPDDEFKYSEIAVPIVYDGKVLGVVDAEHTEKNFFTQDHLETLTTITNLAASKINSTISWEQQLKIESELKDSESKFRKIINSSLDAMIMIDTKGFITEWNKQSENMFGFKKDEAIGKPLFKLIVPKQHQVAHQKGMAHFRKTGDGPVLNKRIEITAVGKERDEFPIELSIIPITIKNQTYFSSFIRDISEQKASQKKIEEALAREKELNEMKSKFVSMTSHEFRTPLTTIKANVDLLAYKIENNTEQQSINKNVGRIQNELDRLTNLMNDILTIGRIESGRIPFDPVPTRLHELTTEVISQSFAERRDDREIHVNVSGKSKDLMLDPQVFNHIITNLISNALKYSVGKDSPLVSIRYEKDCAWFIVEDEGIGIPKEELDKLSDSFYRASNVGNIQGSGLGLTIVKQFVALHKGEMQIESKENKGTKVSVKLNYPLKN